MRNMHRYAALAILFVAASAGTVRADEITVDARNVGYPDKYFADSPGVSSAWLALVGLGLVCIGPLFLNAHRTHLD